MAAANFSRDVIEMFYGSIEGKQDLPTPIVPDVSGFKIVRNNFKGSQRLYQKIRDEKEKQMNSFIEAHGYAPLQRSDEWFLM